MVPPDHDMILRPASPLWIQSKQTPLSPLSFPSVCCTLGYRWLLSRSLHMSPDCMRWRLCDKPLANHANDICAYRTDMYSQANPVTSAMSPSRYCAESASQCHRHDGTRLTSLLQGIVYDVTGNKAYQPGGSYHGTFPSRLILP